MRGRKADQIIIDDPAPKGDKMRPYKNAAEALADLPKAEKVYPGDKRLPYEALATLYYRLRSRAAQAMAEGWNIFCTGTARSPQLSYYRIAGGADGEDFYLALLDMKKGCDSGYIAEGYNLPELRAVTDLALALAPGRLIIPVDTPRPPAFVTSVFAQSRCRQFADYEVIGAETTGAGLRLLGIGSRQAAIRPDVNEAQDLQMRLRRQAAFLRRIELDSHISLSKIAEALALYNLRRYCFVNSTTLQSGVLSRIDGDVVYLAQQLGDGLGPRVGASHRFKGVSTIIRAILLEKHYRTAVRQHNKIVGAPVASFMAAAMKHCEGGGAMPGDVAEEFAGLCWLRNQMLKNRIEESADGQ